MTGDQNDVYRRIVGYLPPWFGDAPPIIDAVLQGLAYALSFIYALIQYAKTQTRIKTASGGFLDMIAADFFGSSLTRKTNETDSSFLARIIINLFRERATREAVNKVIGDLTGNAPIIVEPKRPLDTGAYGAPNSGYGVAGAYGSLLHPYQAFITVYRPPGVGIPYVAGYGAPSAGYGVASRAEYASLDMVTSGVTDSDIYEAIDSVKPVGTLVWVRIANMPPDVGAPPTNAVVTEDGYYLLTADGHYVIAN